MYRKILSNQVYIFSKKKKNVTRLNSADRLWNKN